MNDAENVKAYKIRLHTAELRMLAAEVAQLRNEAECWLLAKQVYLELLRLERKLKQIRLGSDEEQEEKEKSTP